MLVGCRPLLFPGCSCCVFLLLNAAGHSVYSHVQYVHCHGHSYDMDNRASASTAVQGQEARTQGGRHTNTTPTAWQPRCRCRLQCADIPHRVFSCWHHSGSTRLGAASSSSGCAARTGQGRRAATACCVACFTPCTSEVKGVNNPAVHSKCYKQHHGTRVTRQLS